MDYCLIEFSYYLFGIDSFHTEAGGISKRDVPHYMRISVPSGKNQYGLFPAVAGIHNSKLLR